MRSIVSLLLLAGLLRVFVHLPLGAAVFGAIALWIVWKLKWIVLAIVGIDLLASGD